MVAAHAHPGLVAVTAGPADGLGRRVFSSGLLIAPQLVLTSRHGVACDAAHSVLVWEFSWSPARAEAFGRASRCRVRLLG